MSWQERLRTQSSFWVQGVKAAQSQIGIAPRKKFVRLKVKPKKRS